MRIFENLNDRTVKRKFAERRRPLIVLDHNLPAFGLKIAADESRTFFVRVKRGLSTVNLTLGTTAELTAAQARDRAVAEIGAARAERETGTQFRDFAGEFMRRQSRRWKPATRQNNGSVLKNQLLPFFDSMRVADITRADVQRWFYSLSDSPANANRALPVLSVMFTQAELWAIRPQGSNPCRNIRRYRTKARERFLSLKELKRLGFVLDHAEDKQAVAVIRLLLFTGARSSEITGLRWDWIRGTRALLPDSKTGPKTIQLSPPAREVLHGMPRISHYVFPNARGTGPMNDLGLRWQKRRRLAGLEDVRIHDCRHTLASHAVMSGIDLYTVGRLLGHADIASTERYAHLADDHIREAAGRIGAIVDAAMTGDRKREEVRHGS